MPAVTYYVAQKVLISHGDDMLDYIESAAGDSLADIAKEETSIGGLACKLCSMAVELWCSQFDGNWEDDE